jgi:hypothetical protein
MPLPLLENVFKLSGVPTHTFVKATEYDRLFVALRTSGRGVVIEGPSGIGKTTAVAQALTELDGLDSALRLSARSADDRDFIAELPSLRDAGPVVIDDFHRLEEPLRRRIADFLKVLADEERTDSKLIVVGINKAGDSLVSFAPDLSTRIDIIRLEANPDKSVRELIEKGERALNVAIGAQNSIVHEANGSFFLAQMLCHNLCLEAHVTEAHDSEKPRRIAMGFERVRARVMDELSYKFRDVTLQFARGPKLRREGRAPYLHILRWLAEADEWSITLDHEIDAHPEQRQSVNQVVEKGFLENLLHSNPRFSDILHYEPSTTVLTVEDPQFVFYLRNILWTKFAMQVGYFRAQFPSKYDFALSFAGSERKIAKYLFEILTEMEFQVFFDEDEQHHILAAHVEDYLRPIYRSEAQYVVCFLSNSYPTRLWTKFESEQFKTRFGEGAVIPIWFKDAPRGMFDESSRIGGLEFDPDGNHYDQAVRIAEMLRKKMGTPRLSPRTKLG